MKLAFFLLPFFLLIQFPGITQIFEAKYSVKQSITIPLDKESLSYELNYDGYTYYSGSKFIYFQKPLFLNEYPDGQKIFKSSDNNYAIGNIGIDSIQSINYRNLDSLISYSKNGSANDNTLFYSKYNFEIGARIFKFLPETKIINGLPCQHGSLYTSTDTNKIMADIWFCPDIEINFGPADIADVPGLVVYANYYNTFEVFELTSYGYNQQMNDSIFWPVEFNKAIFTIRNPLRKAQTSGTKTKAQKKADIMNQ